MRGFLPCLATWVALGLKRGLESILEALSMFSIFIISFYPTRSLRGALGTSMPPRPRLLRMRRSSGALPPLRVGMIMNRNSNTHGHGREGCNQVARGCALRPHDAMIRYIKPNASGG